MQLSQVDLCELILIGEEQRNLEYKTHMRWDNDLTKAKITKTALAMSNIRDGGWIVIGVEEQSNNTFRRIGVAQEEADTFRHDDVSSHINEYADPYVKLHIRQVNCEEKKYVIIKVDEFDELPVICRREYPRAELHKGKIYTRARRRNENSEVSAQTEMREIIDIAVDKNVRSFIERLRRTGIISEGVVVNDEEAFTQQLGDLI